MEISGRQSVLGLRATVKPRKAASTNTRSRSTGDVTKDFLGILLDEAMRGQRQRTQQKAPKTREPDAYSEALAPMRISNSFLIAMAFSSREVPVDGFLGVGPYQGQNAGAGYRLLYTPKPRRGEYRFELIKRSARGAITTIAFASVNKLAALEDGKTHALRWQRDKKGRMRISVDDHTLFDVVDRSFGDPFDGFAFVNTGGDYAIRDLVIKVP